MSNANTTHSKALRLAAAKRFNAQITAANKFEIRNKDAAKIAEIKERLKGVHGKDNAEKLLILLDTYDKINNKCE